MSYRGRSYSRSPSRSRSRSPYKKRDDTSIKREPPSRCSLLIRNLHRKTRDSDLRYFFEKYGPVRDVYLPRDYYTGELRGIGFVEYTSPRDAEDAKYQLDKMVLLGREISIVFAMQGRKRPNDYRRGYRRGGGPAHYSRRGPCLTRGRNVSYSPPHRRSSDRGYHSRSPLRRMGSHSPMRSNSQSKSPPVKRYPRESSPEPPRSRSPAYSPPRRKYSGSPSPRNSNQSPSYSVSLNENLEGNSCEDS